MAGIVLLLDIASQPLGQNNSAIFLAEKLAGGGAQTKPISLQRSGPVAFLHHVNKAEKKWDCAIVMEKEVEGGTHTKVALFNGVIQEATG